MGLGEDGHTASIFPDQMHILTSKKICEIGIHPLTGQKRITLTGPVINHARRVVFLVTGRKKSMLLKKIFFNKEKCKKYPACYINPVYGKMTWLLDSDASLFL